MQAACDVQQRWNTIITGEVYSLVATYTHNYGNYAPKYISRCSTTCRLGMFTNSCAGTRRIILRHFTRLVWIVHDSCGYVRTGFSWNGNNLADYSRGGCCQRVMTALNTVSDSPFRHDNTMALASLCDITYGRKALADFIVDFAPAILHVRHRVTLCRTCQ